MRLALAGVLVLVSCTALARESRGKSVQGDGNVTAQKRDVPEFDAVRLETSADVVVKVGPPRSVAVRIDGNLQGLLTTAVEKGVLVIDARQPFRGEREAVVEITVPSLRRFQLDGSGDVSIEGSKGAVELSLEGSGDLRWQGEASTLQARVDGSGDLRLEGRAERLQVRVDGTGDVDAGKLVAVNAEARVEGTGDVELNLGGGTLTAAVDGTGDIRWRGDAKTESIAVHGTGEISRVK
jgi:putative autotransporter adhesin-like protein